MRYYLIISHGEIVRSSYNRYLWKLLTIAKMVFSIDLNVFVYNSWGKSKKGDSENRASYKMKPPLYNKSAKEVGNRYSIYSIIATEVSRL